MKSLKTLTEFQEMLRRGEASLEGGRPLTLEEGLSHAVKMILETHRKGQKVALIGNGGSAAIASHQAVDLWRNGGIRATAFNDPAMLTCLANDFGYEEVFSRPVEMFCETGDLVVAISSSGKSQNIVNAVLTARRMKCLVIGLSGFEMDNPLRRLGDLNLYVPSSSYGIVEVAHLLILHAVVDEVISLKKKAKHEARKTKGALFQHAPNPAG